MNPISRGEFLKLGSLSLLGALVSDSVFANDRFFSATTAKVDLDLMQKLILNNDANVKKKLQEQAIDPNIRLSSYRSLAGEIAVMSASISNSASEYYKSKTVIERLNHNTDVMLKGQYSDGTVEKL